MLKKLKRIILIGLAGLTLTCGLPAMAAPAQTIKPIKITVDSNSSNEWKVFCYLKQCGLNNAAVCGIMANINAESGFNPRAVNRAYGYTGLCQWDKRYRWPTLVSWCGRNGYDCYSVEGQLAFMMHEIMDENAYSDYNYRKIRNYLFGGTIPNSSSGAYDTAYYFCKWFEEYYDSGARSRANAAYNFWNKYSSASIGSNVVKYSDGNWYYTNNGAIDYSYTGIAKNTNGWWRIVNGKVDFNCNSVEKNQNGWWYLRGGKVDFGYTGLAKNANGWWRIENGKVNFNFNGLANNSAGWWKIENGKVNFDFNGLAKNSAGWWYLEGGKVLFDYHGLGENEYGVWKITAGKVDFDYNRIFVYKGNIYAIKNGKVIMSELERESEEENQTIFDMFMEVLYG